MTCFRVAALLLLLFGTVSSFLISPLHLESKVATILASQNSQFDISKPQFDLFSLRNVRGDALAKYSSLNQSEPLRINLFGLLMLSLFSSPILVPEVSGETLSVAQQSGAVITGIVSGGFCLREVRRRSKQLSRMEKELQALDLTIRLPASEVSDFPFLPARQVRELIRENNMRLLVISGSSRALDSSMKELLIYGRRLRQANAFVMLIPTDNDVPAVYNVESNERLSWLTQAGVSSQWREYFNDLQSSTELRSGVSWFGLSSSGRVFGSGTSLPSWMEVLGKSLRPTVVLDENDRDAVRSENDQELLDAQKRFYSALVTGNEKEMSAIYSSDEASSVSTVLEEGGRLDGWKTCLADGARPEGMNIAGADVTFASNTLAYSTVIEFPSVTDVDATLLAKQTWKRESESAPWQLLEHQTIPWASSPAGGTLLCDCRGCVSLVRVAQNSLGTLISN